VCVREREGAPGREKRERERKERERERERDRQTRTRTNTHAYTHTFRQHRTLSVPPPVIAPTTSLLPPSSRLAVIAHTCVRVREGA
jgi:hypothetical protein